MFRLACIALPILLIGSLRVLGQLDSTSEGIYSGTVIDDSLGYPVPSVHLWNESSRLGSVSSASGEFTIRARDQDTIIFSAIGYFSQVWLASSALHEGFIMKFLKVK